VVTIDVVDGEVLARKQRPVRVAAAEEVEARVGIVRHLK
jgi:hypothetical protein